MTLQDSPLTPQQLLDAYASGYFPMADSRESKELYWFSPEVRGIIPLESFHIPRNLKKIIRQKPYEITVNKNFKQVISHCANVKRSHESGSWINPEIINLYHKLSGNGHAFSVEVWADGELIGGLYGVAIGGAFFGESMFSTATNTSKIALVYLVALLKKCGFTLLDTQYTNDHLLQFGVVEIPKGDYLELLDKALYISPNPSKNLVNWVSSDNLTSDFGTNLLDTILKL